MPALIIGVLKRAATGFTAIAAINKKEHLLGFNPTENFLNFLHGDAGRT